MGSMRPAPALFRDDGSPPGYVGALNIASAAWPAPPMTADPSSPEKAPPKGARALLGASLRPCPGCSAPLRPRQTACSGKCRAALSRGRRAAARAAWLRNWAERTYAALGVI